MVRGVAVLLLALTLLAPAVSAEPSGGWGYEWVRSCNATIVAVSGSGEGVTGQLRVTVAYPGRGRVFISTSPASMVDTQGSARLAAFAASLLAGVDPARLDFYYEIETDSIIIGGPSAGLPMALATLLAILGQKCPGNAAATGMIQADTSIGPVGGLREKLEAAAAAGKKLFLVPAGQTVYTYYKTVTRRIGPFIYQERVPVTVNLTQLGEQLGVRVVPVASLAEAYEAVTGTVLILPPHGQPGAPSWLVGSLRSFATRTAQRALNISSAAYTTSPARNLAQTARELAGEAEAANDTYEAAILSVRALSNALAAEIVEYALTNDLNVTPWVETANNSVETLYERLENASPAGVQQAEAIAKAWAEMGIASYEYTQAVSQLEERDGEYSLPTSFFTVNLEPAIILGEALATAEWASYWLNASKLAPDEPPLSTDRLSEVSRLLQDDARTALAYTSTLAQEAGASIDLGAAEWLVEQAVLTSNDIARAGLSIEAISLCTGGIHEAFTLDVASTTSQLSTLALYLEQRSGNASAIASLLVSSTLSEPPSKERLQAASKAVLYAWLAEELSGNSSAANARGGASPAGSPSPLRPAPLPSPPVEGPGGEARSIIGETMLLLAAGILLVLLALGVSRVARGRD